MSTEHVFQLDDLQLNPGAVRRDSFVGIHSGKPLLKFVLNLTTSNQRQTDAVELLLEKRRVRCVDPVEQRSCEVELNLKSSSYQSGHPEKHFVIDGTEVDAWPPVTSLEIEGVPFAVAEYRESEEDDNQVGRHALLRLSEKELRNLRGLVKPESVTFKRVGVDSDPLSLRLGGMLCWSEIKSEDGQKHFHQIVRFYPLRPESPEQQVFALAVVQDNSALLAIETAHKLNSLVDVLRQSGVLSAEKAAEFSVSLDKVGIEESVVDNWWWRMNKVRDAKVYL